MARTVAVRQAALARARERRLALDAERDARDRRVEEATAEVLVLVDARRDAERSLSELDAAIGAALRRLLGEGIGVRGVAGLVGLEPVEVRRRLRASTGAQRSAAEAAQGEPASSGSPVVDR